MLRSKIGLQITLSCWLKYIRKLGYWKGEMLIISCSPELQGGWKGLHTRGSFHHSASTHTHTHTHTTHPPTQHTHTQNTHHTNTHTPPHTHTQTTPVAGASNTFASSVNSRPSLSLKCLCCWHRPGLAARPGLTENGLRSFRDTTNMAKRGENNWWHFTWSCCIVQHLSWVIL